jgi:hypothetical protein
MNQLATRMEPMDLMSVGKIFYESGMFPDAKSSAQCITKLVLGAGMGLNQYESMKGLHVIQGSVVLAANLMAASIKNNPKYDYTSETTEESSTITFFQWEDGKKTRIGDKTFDMDMARRAGIAGGVNWKKYPEAMLFARCISAGYKEHCPDAFGGAPVYVEAHGESEIETGGTVEQYEASIAPALPEPTVIDVEPAVLKPKKTTTKKKAAKKKEEKSINEQLDDRFGADDNTSMRSEVGQGDPRTDERGSGVFNVTAVDEMERGKEGNKFMVYRIHVEGGQFFDTTWEEYATRATECRATDCKAHIFWTRDQWGAKINAPWQKKFEIDGVTSGDHDKLAIHETSEVASG